MNAFAELRRRNNEPGGYDPDTAEPDPPSATQARADALLDIANVAAAADPDITEAACRKARVTVVVPVDRLHHHTTDCDPEDDNDTSVVIDLPDSRRASPDVPDAPAGPGSALWASRIDQLKTNLGSRRPELFGSTWAVGNGPGQGFLAHTDALRLTCEGEITRLLLDPQSQPLDIGRTTRVVPAKLRTAVNIRDGGCAAPGCDRPPGWCEAHHIQHWAHGGKTALSNLLLLCSKHHHDLHRGWWTITTPPNSATPVMHRSRAPNRQPRAA